MLKMIRKRSYEDNTKFHSEVLVTTLSYAMYFRWKSGVIKNFEYLGEFGEETARMLENFDFVIFKVLKLTILLFTFI
jgi:hypothetical protein